MYTIVRKTMHRFVKFQKINVTIMLKLFFSDKLVKNTDHSLVIIRPKFYVGSSGCVWASDLIRLWYEDPDIFKLNLKVFFQSKTEHCMLLSETLSFMSKIVIMKMI